MSVEDWLALARPLKALGWRLVAFDPLLTLEDSRGRRLVITAQQARDIAVAIEGAVCD